MQQHSLFFSRELISEYKQKIKLVSWSTSINKRLKLFSTRSEDQRKHHLFRFARSSSNLLNNQRDQSRTAWSLYLEKQISVSLLQRHSQCNDLLILIALLISELILLLVHMQLVSLLQWHLLSMQWSTRSHRFIYQWTWSNVHMQLVSLLQWHDYLR